jgi:hypothetical protein
MSDISRNARKFAEELEKTADDRKKAANQFKELTHNASDLAKNSIDLQRSITDQLKTKIVPDFPKEKKKIESLQKLANDSLAKASSVYDESLTLFANTNAIQIPEPNMAPIKNSASELNGSAAEIAKELDEALTKNNNLLSDLEDNIHLSTILIQRYLI